MMTAASPPFDPTMMESLQVHVADQHDGGDSGHQSLPQRPHPAVRLIRFRRSFRSVSGCAPSMCAGRFCESMRTRAWASVAAFSVLTTACAEPSLPAPERSSPLPSEESVPRDATVGIATRPSLNGRDFPDKVIALTWDDGPDAGTVALAAYLHRQKISATFFVVSGWIDGLSSEPGAGKGVFETGHEYLPVLGELVNLGHRIGAITRCITAVLLDRADPATHPPRDPRESDKDRSLRHQRNSLPSSPRWRPGTPRPRAHCPPILLARSIGRTHRLGHRPQGLGGLAVLSIVLAHSRMRARQRPTTSFV